MTNIRYITATHIGTWAQDKLNRFCLLPQHDEPIMWDFGSAARHHQLYNPWLADGRSRAGISTLRGAMSPESGRAENVAEKIARRARATRPPERAGRWTPPLTSGCLPGITRAVLLEEVRVPGIQAGEKVLFPADLEAADEVFIASTTRELMPVASIQGLKIRGQRSVTGALQTAFTGCVKAHVAARLRPVTTS